jgi:hypothetical protein
VGVGIVADVSDVHVASVFRAEMNNVSEVCVCTGFGRNGVGDGGGAGALSGLIGTMDGNKFSIHPFQGHKVHKHFINSWCSQAVTQ